MDALLLSRIQFGFVISFHILFPAFTIGLASWLAFLEWRWLRTQDIAVARAVFFWLKIFAVSFGMGVVSGIVMSFQFGTNWAVLSERAGNILGPLLSYEVLTAFFLEATFLGVMLFGFKRVPPKLHFFATCMVALGTLISTFWIIAANSWMQTPQGHVIDAQGVFQPAELVGDHLQPVVPVPPGAHGARRVHHDVLRDRRRRRVVPAARRARGGGEADAAAGGGVRRDRGAVADPRRRPAWPERRQAPADEARGDGSALAPNAGEGVPLVLFAVPNEAAERNDYEIAIPRLGSLILTHSLDGKFQPLTAVPARASGRRWCRCSSRSG